MFIKLSIGLNENLALSYPIRDKEIFIFGYRIKTNMGGYKTSKDDLPPDKTERRNAIGLRGGLELVLEGSIKILNNAPRYGSLIERKEGTLDFVGEEDFYFSMVGILKIVNAHLGTPKSNSAYGAAALQAARFMECRGCAEDLYNDAIDSFERAILLGSPEETDDYLFMASAQKELADIRSGNEKLYQQAISNLNTAIVISRTDEDEAKGYYLLAKTKVALAKLYSGNKRKDMQREALDDLQEAYKLSEDPDVLEMVHEVQEMLG